MSKFLDNAYLSVSSTKIKHCNDIANKLQQLGILASITPNTSVVLQDNNYVIENVSFKENNPVAIIEESAKLKIAYNLIKHGKKVTIKDRESIIREVKKEYGKLFSYESVSTNSTQPS